MQPNPLAIAALCVGGAAALIFLLWLNHTLRTGIKKTPPATPGQTALMTEYALSYLLGGTGSVNDYLDDAGDVMSPTACAVPHEEASAVQTRPQTPPDRPMMPIPMRDEMLDAFKILRKSGIAREDARAMLRLLGHPLDNNLWSKAAPEEEPQVTPIAQRPTAAKFHDDPELEYQPLR